MRYSFYFHTHTHTHTHTQRRAPFFECEYEEKMPITVPHPVEKRYGIEREFGIISDNQI